MFSLLKHLLPPPTPRPDPIDHPDIQAMSQRELADLPLPRHTAWPLAPACAADECPTRKPIAVRCGIGEARTG